MPIRSVVSIYDIRMMKIKYYHDYYYYLSLGVRSVRAGVRRDAKDRCKEALIPLGGSNTSLYDCRIRVDGTFGLNSIVRKSLKF